MQRERVVLSAVYHTAMRDEANGDTVGYLRLSQFSSSAAEDMKLAIQELEVCGGRD